MSKPSKVLIIGSGPIIIGQACCHSEGAEALSEAKSQRLKNLGVEWQEKPYPDTLRFAQGDNEGTQSERE